MSFYQGLGHTCWRCHAWVPNGCTHYCPTWTMPVQWTVNPTITTSTLTTAESLLLRVARDEGFYVVTDVVGTRFGHAETLKDALAAWEVQVADLLALDEATLGDPILSETRAYRAALGASVEDGAQPEYSPSVLVGETE